VDKLEKFYVCRPDKKKPISNVFETEDKGGGSARQVPGVSKEHGDVADIPSPLEKMINNLTCADTAAVREGTRFLAKNIPTHGDQTAYGQKKF